MEITTLSPSASLIQHIYARMLLTRIVDTCALRLHVQSQGQSGFVASCCGYEAAQVGSAVCIEVGNDFTLPYYRDLGVVLTIGMTPYEVFRTYLQTQPQAHGGTEGGKSVAERGQVPLHWGYHKHNMVTGPAPVATQILHAAGIAFASKLRKAPVVTVAYCGDGATAEPDFLEGITFAAQHQLPAVFICEQTYFEAQVPTSSSLQQVPLPTGLEHVCIDGSDVIAVYSAMQVAMQHARDGYGPVLLEMYIRPAVTTEAKWRSDPLVQCQRYLEEHEMWDEQWALQLRTRLEDEAEQAMQDALRHVS